MTLQRERLPLGRGAAHSTSVSPTKAKGSTKARISYEYRLSWRRGDWAEGTKTKTRSFARRSDAEAFYDKLTGGERPELSSLSVLQIDVRRVGVGPWSRTQL